MSRKRTKTRYEGVYYRVKENGVKTFDIKYTRDKKPVWEVVGAAPTYSAEVARDIRGKRLKEVRHENDLPQDRGVAPTFGAVAEKYLEWATREKRSFEADTIRYRLHLKPRFAKKQVDRIAPLDLERLKKELREAGKTPATVRQVLALFRAIFNVGIKRGKKRKGGEAWGMIPKNTNPADEVELPRLDNTRERRLSPEEVELLLSALEERSPQAHGIALIGYHTGARLAEITELLWGDVDLNGAVVTFRGTKSGRTRRIPLNSEALAYLTALGAGKPNERVFPRRSDKRWSASTFQAVADELFNQGVADPRHKVVFHSLRHACASRLVEAGVPLNVVRDILGHRTLAMLERYAHLAPGAQKSAVELLAVPATAQDKGEEVAG